MPENTEEMQYLNLLKHILETGTECQDRTGIGTKKIFGAQMRFSLRDQFPILTTKKVFWKGVVEELLWFIRGDTNSKHLEEKGVNIWKGNTSREFLDQRGLKNYPEGELGPGYGWQWRRFNEEYPYATKKPGVDQLQNVVSLIRNDPNSRRMIVCAWNPCQLDQMALPPCHMMYQFFVANGELSCLLHCRSNDFYLGNPFNVSSYSLLTYLIAKITNLKPGDFVWIGGDVHIYLNHLDAVREQLTRTPYPFPQLAIKKDIHELSDIEKMTLEDFELVGYKCHPTIKAPMAV